MSQQLEKLLTVGIYGFDSDHFISSLFSNGVDCLVDVRRRRAVRGARYAFANATRLDAALAQAGITSIVAKDLAPSVELRAVQQSADKALRQLKSQRRGLDPLFVEGYREEVLNHHTSGEVLGRLSAYARPALLCVERDPGACHRSILGEWLADAGGVPLEHIWG